MTRGTRKVAIVTALVAACTLLAPTPVSHAQLPVVVLEFGRDADVAPDEPDAALPVDLGAVRDELARTLRAFVVGAAAASAHDVPPVAMAHVHFRDDGARVVVQRPGTPEAAPDTQELVFHGSVTQARLVGLILALLGPAASAPAPTGMDVRVNPYRDPNVSVAHLDSVPARTHDAFFAPNPYRVADAVPARRTPPMAIGQNPYR